VSPSGPPYPAIQPGSNAIGEFAIGVSQIGDIIPFDFWQTIISQYSNSPILTKLIANFDSYIDQTQNLDAFYDFLWNVATAQGYGLDVWGRIVNVKRTLQVPIGNWFGFAEASPGSEPWGQGAFYSGDPLNGNYALSDAAYRTLIYAKAAANITDGSIPAINQILLNLFPNRGNCYVTDGESYGPWFGFAEAINSLPFNQGQFYSGSSVSSMVMAYVFTFPLTPVELAIVQQSGVLPKPTGVAASVVLLN
jgi:hypothetical protein